MLYHTYNDRHMANRKIILNNGLIRAGAKIRHSMRYPNDPVYKWKLKKYRAIQARLLTFIDK